MLIGRFRLRVDDKWRLRMQRELYVTFQTGPQGAPVHKVLVVPAVDANLRSRWHLDVLVDVAVGAERARSSVK